MKLVTVLFIFFTTLSYSQPLTILKKIITTTNLTSETGLSLRVNGRENENGLYYFMASHTGSIADIWQTDATPVHTIKIESEPIFNLWDRIYFVREGAFIDTYSDKLLFYNNDSDVMTELADLDDLEFQTPKTFGEGKYLFLMDSVDTIHELWYSDLTIGGTYEIGNVGIYNGYNTLTASPYGAVVANTNIFVGFEPVIYNPVAGTILTIKEYLMPYKIVNSVKYASIYEKLLFMTVNENGFDKHYIFDMDSHMFYPGVNLDAVREFRLYGGDLIIVTERGIAHMDLATLSITKDTDKAYFLGKYLFYEDKLFFQINTSGITYIIASYDLDDHTITTYPSLDIGDSNYNPKMAIYKDELFFISLFQSTQLLKKYNFDNEIVTVVDTIAQGSGGGSYTTELIEVNGILLVSKYIPNVGHEMYYYSGTTGTLDLLSDIQELIVYPNPANEEIKLNLSYQSQKIIMLYNDSGQVVSKLQTNNNSIQVNSLTPGTYHGIVSNETEILRFTFVKE